MKTNAYAKINIRLNVIGKRENGYHELFMINARVSLKDEIEFKESSYNKVYYSLEELNNLDTDQCLNVLNEIINSYNINKKYHVYIKKNIPLGAGLGGGSADIAYIINYLDYTHNLKLTLDEKISIGLKYGADVPYCLINDIAVVEGIGEKITPLNKKINKRVLIVYPNLFVSTKKVFEQHIELNHYINKEEIMNYIINEDMDNLLENDLENYTFKLYPSLKEIKLKLSTISKTVMSGSGSTMLVFVENDAQVKKIKEIYPDFLMFDTFIL